MSPVSLLPIATKARDAGLSMIDFHALCEVWNHNAIQPKSLAARLKISTASITDVTDRLEKSGFVERIRHQSDRRGLFIAITPLGSATLQVIASYPIPA